MYGSDELDPHREVAHLPNPFADDNDVGGNDRDSDSDGGSVAASDETEQAASEGVAAGNSAAASSVIQQQPQSQQPRPVLLFTVGHIVDRSKRTPVYTLDVVTNMPAFKARKYTGVQRSQVELERLETHLRATYPECLVPTLGPGTTASKYVAEYQNDRLVVQLLQQWVDRVAGHAILRQDYELRQFVEAPFVFNPALSSAPALTMAPPPSSSLSLSSQSGGFFSWGRSRQQQTQTQQQQQTQTQNQAEGASFERWLDAAMANLGVFQRNVAEAQRWHGRLSRTRLRLSGDLRDVGTKLVSLGVIEHSALASRAFKRLGKSILHTGPCLQTLANCEGSRAWAILGLLAAGCVDVQRTVRCRGLIFTEHQVAERQVTRKQQAAAVLRSSASIDSARAMEAVAELEAARADAESRRVRAERVDRVLDADMRAFERRREGDVRAMFAALARDHLAVERQVLAEQRAALDFVRQR
ncbi:Vacuolar protein sorting-associated protein 17 [Coemansia erecta]|uniref:Vacuolar protein sorting-associated protein 17 n=1 Tax=Coemansia erecta TaxID=147472 RepID=A0A9W7XYI6_9FUNG|nr:Vacuolar protein sorting-associated protein 17 [Coemansia erecta]